MWSRAGHSDLLLATCNGLLVSCHSRIQFTNNDLVCRCITRLHNLSVTQQLL
ncbi:hypothetical protein J6590_092091, partial [Homalodisca vitripennis]